MMLIAPQKPAQRGTPIVAASLLVHLLLLVLLTHHSYLRVAPVRSPGTARGTRMVLTYMPGPAPAAPASAVAHVQTPPRPPRPSPALHQPPAPAQTAVASLAVPHQDPGNGIDALGDGDVSIALMQFFPDPRPDLSRLPHGTRGDVVLEAIIDANGRIAQLTIKQGVGYGVDESVIATVEQWTFHPATRDGKPVASLQEFHFHYERG